MARLKVIKLRPGGFNTTQAANYCAVSEGLMRKLRQNGEGPRFCRVGTKIVYRRVDLEEYLEECLV